MTHVTISRRLTLAGFSLTAALLASPFASAEPALLQPQSLIVDQSLPKAQRDAMELAARRYGSFWNTGEEALAKAALSEQFVDKTPPEGRVQGPTGPLLASKFFRTAVPDLSCEIEQMIIAGDRVVVHLHFHGHFTGPFKALKGQGQRVDFRATDIYQIDNGRIAANWHIEDNISLMQQLQAQPPAS
ncbi:ester cyclase [Pseudomonas frederiksbergensis]|uniref:Ester cyclase n=1 Tax=Pseudomonas frederiksbergensis TaxID=104087 RepID=A0A2S8H7D2_9PSED|nr:ester cyclase [Pseudomonas frederiksbergensis]PQO98393.1 ester cyclase [Pseudomonas frederiksbergensis]